MRRSYKKACTDIVKQSYSQAELKKQPDVTAFDEFMKNTGFTEKTIGILKENGFESADELGLLVGRTDDIDIGLTLAQKLKLSRYVTDIAPGRGERAQCSADLVSVLHELKDSQDEVTQAQTKGAVSTWANPETSELAVADPSYLSAGCFRYVFVYRYC